MGRDIRVGSQQGQRLRGAMREQARDAVRQAQVRFPLCARCRTRHKAHTAIAYIDSFDHAWRCLGCHSLLDADGECNTERCCGNPTRHGMALGEGYSVRHSDRPSDGDNDR